MSLATAVMVIALVALALCLVSPTVRSWLTMIALRRFFDRYMSRPRYRVYNLREDEDEDPPKNAGKEPSASPRRGDG